MRQLDDVRRRHLVFFLRRFDFGEIEDVVDQLRKPPALSLDVLAVLADFLLRDDAAEAHVFAG